MTKSDKRGAIRGSITNHFLLKSMKLKGFGDILSPFSGQKDKFTTNPEDKDKNEDNICWCKP